MKRTKKDLILITGILITAFLLWLIPFILNKDIPGKVIVMQDGSRIASYPLYEDLTETIYCGDGNYNLLLISNGEASISDADCPDKLCVHQHSISRTGESIICLPHKLVIQIEAEEESELDAVTY